MKKSFVTILALCSMVVYVHAQGSFVIDSSVNIGNGSGPGATTGGLVWILNYNTDPTNGTPNLDTDTDINLSVLWGTSAGSVTTHLNIDPLGLNTGVGAGSGNWLASQPTGMEDITGYGSGALLDINGNAYFPPGEAAGTTIWLVLQGWTGSATTYANSFFGGGEAGQTAPFSITLAANTSPVQPDVHGMGALVIGGIPEPSMLALSSLGAAALMLVRRKK